MKLHQATSCDNRQRLVRTLHPQQPLGKLQLLDHDDQRACPDEALLVMADFATGVQKEVGRRCMHRDGMWHGAKLAAGQMVAQLVLESPTPGDAAALQIV